MIVKFVINDIFIWIWQLYGDIPLHLACRFGTIEIVECLMKHGAQIDMQDEVSDES